MKLKNKRSGEIKEFVLFDGKNELQGGATLKDLVKEWEDYEELKEHWYIDWDGEVRHDEYASADQIEIGNYFETKEEAEKAVEKLKAWKRLKDKGFSFIGKTYETDKRFGSIFYKVDEDTYSEDIIDDLDLLFGGEDE